MALTRLKEADLKTKCVIFGYSRQQQNEISMSIPSMIQYLFLMYYWIQEKFTKCGKHIVLDSKCKKAQKKYKNVFCPYDTVYGNNVIDIDDTSIKIYKWTLKISASLGFSPSYPMCIGIDSYHESMNDDFSSTHVNPGEFYSIGSNGGCYSWNQSKEIFKQEILTEDNIVLILNVVDRKLMCCINDVKEYLVADNIDFDKEESYNLAVGICQLEEKVEIVRFEAIQR